MTASDPFELLDLPRRFELDRAALRSAYLQRAARLHPDRFRDPVERAEAARRAAELNDARAILADDERRANALLALLGGPDREDEKTLPDGFLMEIMDVRQEMEAALASGDPAERARFEAWAAEQRTERLEAIAGLFERALASPDQDLLAAIRVELNALRYIERMIEQLDPDHEPPM
jgi:molecular chaperone HscB